MFFDLMFLIDVWFIIKAINRFINKGIYVPLFDVLMNE